MSKYIINAKAVEYRKIDVVRWKAPHKFHYKKLVREGIYTVFDSMLLGCRYFLDENGNKVYCVNESPHEKGLRVLAECCIPVIQAPITEASQTTTNTNRTANQQGSLHSIWYTVSCIYNQVHGTDTSCAQGQVIHNYQKIERDKRIRAVVWQSTTTPLILPSVNRLYLVFQTNIQPKTRLFTN